jgi:hypothetical protein
VASIQSIECDALYRQADSSRVAIRRRLFLAVAVFVASILAGWAIFGIIKLVALAL